MSSAYHRVQCAGLYARSHAVELRLHARGRAHRRTRSSSPCHRGHASARPSSSTSPSAAHDRRRPRVLSPMCRSISTRRQQQRRRVREVLAGDVGRAAVHGLEHGRSRCRGCAAAPRPARRPAPRTDPRRCRRTGSAAAARRTASGSITRCMHAASTIRSSYVMSGYSGATAAHAVEEQPVAELHDVGLVDRR